jgi:hypothetical protein
MQDEKPVQIPQSRDQFVAGGIVAYLDPPVTSQAHHAKSRVDTGVLCFRRVQTSLPVRVQQGAQRRPKQFVLASMVVMQQLAQ